MDEEIKETEDQIVEDTDADTRDVIEDVEENGAAIGDVLARLDNLEDTLAGMFDNLATVIVKSGSSVVLDDPIEDVEDAYVPLIDMDYRLTDD